MANTPKVVKFVFNADGYVETMKRFRAAVDANPMRDDETPVEWMRRVTEAVFWAPEGWDATDSPSPGSDS